MKKEYTGIVSGKTIIGFPTEELGENGDSYYVTASFFSGEVEILVKDVFDDWVNTLCSLPTEDVSLQKAIRYILSRVEEYTINQKCVLEIGRFIIARKCDKCGHVDMIWVEPERSPYPRGHGECPKCGFVVSKK